MQNSFVRDLVSLADPTNRFSFLSFLKTKSRLLQFLNSGVFFPTREEFVQYFAWVASQLRGVQFGAEAKAVSFDPRQRAFHVSYEAGGQLRELTCEHVVVGTGWEPARIDGENEAPDNCLHVSELLHRRPALTSKSVLVVGGAQSGGELIDYLLSDYGPAAEITWVSRGTNISALDTGNFTREYYTPGYAELFTRLEVESKGRILAEEARAEKGISPSLLQSLYQRIYHLRHVRQGDVSIRIVPSTEVTGISKASQGCDVACRSLTTNHAFQVRADYVILCTGFEAPRLRILEPLRQFGLNTTPPLNVGSGYSLRWDGPSDRSIFVQSFARESHGLGDPNFTMVCHRNSVIINRFAGSEIFAVDVDDLLADWSGFLAPGR